MKPITTQPPLWTRRKWVTHNAALLAVAPSIVGGKRPWVRTGTHTLPSLMAEDALPNWETLAQDAVAAAKRAGAHYADARLTRSIIHRLAFTEVDGWFEWIGVGVRALYNGYWGFAAEPSGDPAEIERLAKDAVSQAKLYARGLPRTVDLGTNPPAVGHWQMPVRVDPFQVPFEEKLAAMQSWVDYSVELGTPINPIASELHFLRQDQVVATSDGSHFTQTVYEAGGEIQVATGRNGALSLEQLSPVAKGWELALDADIPAQLRAVPERFAAQQAWLAHGKPAQVGRYTVVCDAATMGSLIDRTWGVATQIDRALGYEADTSGTSFLNDPLVMLGQLQVASPHVTLTANRSAPGQLATVKWDAEGVEPDQFALIQSGTLVDYQTTREQAAWLAPYYHRHGKPVRSHGCSAADTALCTPMQQTPNLALTPNPATVTRDDLVADVTDGILITEGEATADFQAQTGVIRGVMHEIKNGKVGPLLVGGSVSYSTLDLWKNVVAVGGQATQEIVASSWFPYPPEFERLAGTYPVKGEPPQRTSASIQAVAATITKQALIDLWRKA